MEINLSLVKVKTKIRKSKTNKKPDSPPGIGDKVFAKTYMDNKLCYGKITHMHEPGKDGNSYFSIACEISGRYELADINTVIHDPKKSHWTAVNKSYIRNNY